MEHRFGAPSCAPTAPRHPAVMTAQPPLFLYREALRLGTSRQLTSAHRSGSLTRLARGAYIETAAWMSLTPDEKYRARVRAAAAISPPESQFCLDSAAALWRLPSIGPWPATAHELVAPSSGGTSRVGIRRYARGRDSSPALIDDVTVTSLARTIVDMSGTTPFVRAVTMADHALRMGLAKHEITRVIDALEPYRGLGRARRVVEFASEQSESPGESFSRVQFLALGYPPPELQVEFFDEQGSIGFVDFFWRELGLVAEFDGRSKYGALRKYQRDMSLEQILLSEKDREDRLRRVARSFVRLDWVKVSDRRRLAGFLRPAGLIEKGRSTKHIREPV
jgi:hypothetical protein